MTNLFQRINYFLFIRTRYQLEKLPWKILGLFHKTDTGLSLFIKNRADWDTYNEIFVKGDYNDAIEKALSVYKNNDDNQPFRFLDLGSNVGFFTLKVIDSLLEQQDSSINFEGTLVEGSPTVYRELQKRLSGERVLSGKLKLIHGLVGKRNGVAKIFESGNHITNSVSSDSSIRRIVGGVDVHYTDVNQFYGDDTRIDLLKGDIEGAELEFVENYQDLFSKVKVAVFEFHHLKCNTAKCVKTLADYGLVNREILFSYGNMTSVEAFWK